MKPTGTNSISRGTFKGSSHRFCMVTAGILLALCSPVRRTDAQALLVASLHDNAVQRVGLNGAVSTVASDMVPASGGINSGSVYDCAVDRYGNIYYCVSIQNRIIKVDRSGVQTNFAYLSNPAAMCIGADGNMYVSSYNTGSIIKITPAGVQINYASGLQDPYGITIDKHGTVYVACEGEGPGKGIYEIPQGGSPTFLAMVSHPARLALDSNGNLYATDWLAGGVYSISSSGAVSAYVTGFHDPLGIAFDNQNNLYVAETPSEWGGSGGGPERIVEVQAISHAESTLTYNVSGIDGIKFTSESYENFTPEPGGMALLLAGGIAGAAAANRKRRRGASSNI